MYSILLSKKFLRILKKLDPAMREFIIDEIQDLSKDPFLHPQVKKIRGVKDGAYRLRIGRWRVLYFIINQDQIIKVIDLFIKKSPSDYRKRL